MKSRIPALRSRLLSTIVLVPCSALNVFADDATPSPVVSSKQVERLKAEIQPLLESRCYDCHAYGASEGGVVFDQYKTPEELVADRKLWSRVLRMVRSDMMPPNGDSLDAAHQTLMTDWVKRDVMQLDPARPDPGVVTVRRLNRVEYKNTIRDLLGVDFKVEENFPSDDAGHGFDNIADVQTISPILLEKYISAANRIVDEAVPKVGWVLAEQFVAGKDFDADEGTELEQNGSRVALSYYLPATLVGKLDVKHSGAYNVELHLGIDETYVDNVFDYNKCKLVFSINNEVAWEQEFAREGDKTFQAKLERELEAGEHQVSFRLEPLTDETKVRDLKLLVYGVKLIGPTGDDHLVRPPNYAKFFPEDVPESDSDRLAYAARILEPFARKAFRRPVDAEFIERAAAFALENSKMPNATFESGVAAAIAAIISSPRFIFREEGVLKTSEAGSVAASQEESSESLQIAQLDDYALASRLSYFLWSSMPDEQLLELADKGELRQNLVPQVDRMLADWKAFAFTQNFVGQWLRSRDIESVPVNAAAVLARDAAPDPDADKARERFRELRRKDEADLTEEEKAELVEARTKLFSGFRRFRGFDLNYELRQSMRNETEMLFDFIVDENRSILELLDADYTFLNERLAKHYGIEGVEGDEMQRVELPSGSPRGGVLTQGTFLAVTSNPDRTSPVKRGLFILENLLGTPPAPPPPDIPPLEDALNGRDPKSLTLRETLEIHRQEAVCAGCHNRMDPLGLGLENFNAVGMWRDNERQDAIDPQGELITGEKFTNIQELKSVLKNERRGEFYRTITEKLMTYALGRGVEYHDLDTVDGIVDKLESSGGLAKDLIYGVVESPAFTQVRLNNPES